MTFVPNLLGIVEAARTPQMMLSLKIACEMIAANARSIAPVDEQGPHYRDMIRTFVEIGPKGMAEGHVSAYKFTSGFVEFGTINNPAFAPLRRAAEAFGNFDESASAQGELSLEFEEEAPTDVNI